MLAGTISIFYVSEIIKSNLKEAVYQDFGEHTGVLLGIKGLKKDIDNRVDALGEYSLYDIILSKNNKKRKYCFNIPHTANNIIIVAGNPKMTLIVKV
ncbi:hypothetical protein [Massilibacterium senegalense]|uniref:hypothetical protein n=1 Tax=Massilibacterium senegalense TaxID=1632858 RepID=UPI000781BA4F|nr:hypothetical protein [Massilibacterium senegalense]